MWMSVANGIGYSLLAIQCLQMIFRGNSQDPDYIVDDFVYSFLGESADFFNQAIFINHHNVGTPCQAGLWEVCLTFFEEDISRKNGVFCLFCEGHNHYSTKFASINGIPLN